MKRIVLSTIFCGLMLGIVGSASADPKSSQLLRGLGDRVFLVNVEVVADPYGIIGVGVMFPNCYVFNADGSWDDPGFPVPGTWMQHSVGANTSYSASADAGDGFVITQEGEVSPAQGGGVLQIIANSEIALFGLGFLSTGFEVEGCPL